MPGIDHYAAGPRSDAVWAIWSQPLQSDPSCSVFTVSAFRIEIAQTPIADDPQANGWTVRSTMRRAAERAPARGVSRGSAVRPRKGTDPILAGRRDRYAIRGPRSTRWPTSAPARPLAAARLGSSVDLTHSAADSMYVISDRGSIVDRYDKRTCSNAAITTFDSPASTRSLRSRRAALRSRGVHRGQLPRPVRRNERLGVDRVLLSAYPVDPIFAVKACAHAAINNYWVGLSAPAPVRTTCSPPLLIGRDGVCIEEVHPGDDLDGRSDRPARPRLPRRRRSRPAVESTRRTATLTPAAVLPTLGAVTGQLVDERWRRALISGEKRGEGAGRGLGAAVLVRGSSDGVLSRRAVDGHDRPPARAVLAAQLDIEAAPVVLDPDAVRLVAVFVQIPPALGVGDERRPSGCWAPTRRPQTTVQTIDCRLEPHSTARPAEGGVARREARRSVLRLDVR